MERRLVAKLRPHQREGVQFMFNCLSGLKPGGYTGSILMDGMGLGEWQKHVQRYLVYKRFVQWQKSYVASSILRLLGGANIVSLWLLGCRPQCSIPPKHNAFRNSYQNIFSNCNVSQMQGRHSKLFAPFGPWSQQVLACLPYDARGSLADCPMHNLPDLLLKTMPYCASFSYKAMSY